MNNEYSTVGLYEHNAESYKKVKEALIEDNIAAIVHATGTGKSYNALQLAYDNQNKKILYVVPSNGIIEHIKKIIDDNPNLDFGRDFSNLEFRTYQSFISMTRKEIQSLDLNMLILDEFHHIGAPIWGERISNLIETHPNIKIFGMTAYTVRDRGTVYERDMVNPETNELFSNKVASRYDFCDAMIDGVLPKPVYRSAYVLEMLQDEVIKLEKIFQTMNPKDELYNEFKETLDAAKKRIASAPPVFLM